ncbi:protein DETOXIFICATION 46, chloroplastic isoform X1 [Selaginella moellendorffii]|uniref:protein DETOXIFICATION 46, chloroplastic isoform X1 n=2 Tax=Selaginella moellendorffii TaxID=88036 RepID=UPI000D1D024F|nr:protein DETOXIFICATION 46, chloroplastic isoform X1 [Selaginella moellendorffii]|eukprot:XP_002991913.2 protein DETOXIFICATION 46, chloroplastic isoform X1 [Selaginella moellendorffii]
MPIGYVGAAVGGFPSWTGTDSTWGLVRIRSFAAPAPSLEASIRECRPRRDWRSQASQRGGYRFRNSDGKFEYISKEEFYESSAAADGSSGVVLRLVWGKKLLRQFWKIMTFAGPALGIWLFSPLMSLIDTAVIGNCSTLELAALGPATVLCDHVSYLFMFLSVATSNLVATSLARNDLEEAAQHLSRLLLISLSLGIGMLVLMELYATPLLQGFLKSQNSFLVSPAATYVKIRALSWPAMLVGMVAQSAILGMKDSWSPLKVLAIAGAINAVGDILLCSYLGCGIAGAAWATSFAQYVAVVLMLKSLVQKGYNIFLVCLPSRKDLKQLLKIVVPVLTTTVFEVVFYTLCTYLASTLGPLNLAAHQVMIGIQNLCYVWGEPLAQTAQTFMPALLDGSSRDLNQARVLLQILLIIGATVGLVAGFSAISIPWLVPQVFTKDVVIIEKMRRISLPVLCTLVVTPPMLALEGTLLAGRDLKFLGLAMVCCYSGGIMVTLAFYRAGFGLPGFWWTLFLIELSRTSVALIRLTSSQSFLADKRRPSGREKLERG